MRTLVTGGAGFIGSNLVDRLVLDGHSVTVIDNESSDSNEQFYWNSNAKNYKCDIRDYEMVRRLYENQDVVFHLAAEARIQPTIDDPLKAFENNIIGTATVLECARSCGVKRVIYSSTSAAYGLNSDYPLSENMPTDCLNPYSVSKVAGEEMCRMYAKLYGMETVCLRYFNVYGERQPMSGQYAPVVGIFLRQKTAKEPMTIFGDGEQRRDFVYVGDVVLANIKAATMKQNKTYQWGQIYNIGTGKNYSVIEIANLIGGEIVHLPSRTGEVQISLADTSKTKTHLDWNSTISVEQWISRYKYP